MSGIREEEEPKGTDKLASRGNEVSLRWTEMPI